MGFRELQIKLRTCCHLCLNFCHQLDSFFQTLSSSATFAAAGCKNEIISPIRKPVRSKTKLFGNLYIWSFMLGHAHLHRNAKISLLRWKWEPGLNFGPINKAPGPEPKELLRMPKETWSILLKVTSWSLTMGLRGLLELNIGSGRTMAFCPSESGSNPRIVLAFLEMLSNYSRWVLRTGNRKCFFLLSCFLSFKHSEYIHCIVPIESKKGKINPPKRPVKAQI